MDNGTEMTAHAMTDWCRFTGVDRRSTAVSRRIPHHRTVRSMFEVQVLAEDWRIEYRGTYRPDGSLEFLTPEAYRKSVSTTLEN